MKYKLFKIKPGKLEQWKAWCHKLNTEYRSEAIKTLKEEGNTRETVILMNDYVWYGIEGKRLPQSDCELNKEHRRNFVECLDPALPEDFSNDFHVPIILDITA